MPYEIQARPTQIHVTIYGEVTSSDLLRYAKEVFALEADSPVSRNLITEFSNIQAWNLSSAEMQKFASARGTVALKNPVKSAIVATRDVDYGMARMFELLIAAPNMEVRVFRDARSAVEWLDQVSNRDGRRG